MTRKLSSAELRLREIQERLEDANHFIETLQVPQAFAPAMLTGRLELLRLAEPVPFTKDQSAVLFQFVGGLIETNMLLREHTELVAQMAHDAANAIYGALGVADRLQSYARYQLPRDDDRREE